MAYTLEVMRGTNCWDFKCSIETLKDAIAAGKSMSVNNPIRINRIRSPHRWEHSLIIYKGKEIWNYKDKNADFKYDIIEKGLLFWHK